MPQSSHASIFVSDFYDEYDFACNFYSNGPTLLNDNTLAADGHMLHFFPPSFPLSFYVIRITAACVGVSVQMCAFINTYVYICMRACVHLRVVFN